MLKNRKLLEYKGQNKVKFYLDPTYFQKKEFSKITEIPSELLGLILSSFIKIGNDGSISFTASYGRDYTESVNTAAIVYQLTGNSIADHDYNKNADEEEKNEDHFNLEVIDKASKFQKIDNRTNLLNNNIYFYSDKGIIDKHLFHNLESEYEEVSRENLIFPKDLVLNKEIIRYWLGTTSGSSTSTHDDQGNPASIFIYTRFLNNNYAFEALTKFFSKINIKPSQRKFNGKIDRIVINHKNNDCNRFLYWILDRYHIKKFDDEIYQFLKMHWYTRHLYNKNETKSAFADIAFYKKKIQALKDMKNIDKSFRKDELNFIIGQFNRFSRTEKMIGVLHKLLMGEVILDESTKKRLNIKEGEDINIKNLLVLEISDEEKQVLKDYYANFLNESSMHFNRLMKK